MLRWTFDRARIVGTVTGLLLLSVPRPGIADGIGKHLRRVGTSRTETARPASGKLPPLERLKARSPRARWESVKKTTREGLKPLPSLDGSRNALQPLPRLESTSPVRPAPDVQVLESPADQKVIVPMPREPRQRPDLPNPDETFLPSLEREARLPDAEPLGTENPLETENPFEPENPIAAGEGTQPAPGTQPAHVTGNRQLPAVPVEEIPTANSDLSADWEPVPPQEAVAFQDEEKIPPLPDDTDDSSMGLLSKITETKLDTIMPRLDYRPIPRGGSLADTVPRELIVNDQPYSQRRAPAIKYCWAASNVYHRPLYFEDATLERYGHTHDLLIEPFISVAKFGGQLVALPYQMSVDPIWKKRYPLGWYRPGAHVPHMYYQVPWNTEAAIHQAAVTAGFIYAFP